MAAEVVVVGGGLAGLTAARRIAEAGLDVCLFEETGSVGGRVGSISRDGYVFDRGFQVLFTAYPAARRELDYDALDLRRFSPGVCIARPWTRSTLSDPLRDVRSLPASLFNREIGQRDKLETLRLRRELARRSPESCFDGADATIAEYLRERGFSRAFAENFVKPFYGGITLDRSLGTSSRVFEYTFKMLSEGDIAVPAEGMSAIPEQLAASAKAAGVTITTGEAVRALDADGDEVAISLPGETLVADRVVVATDPPTARDLTDVASIPTGGRGCVTQYYALPGPELDAGSKLIVNAADGEPNHVASHSAVAPEYASDGDVLLSATFLGEREESDRRLAEIAHNAIGSWYPERQFDDLEPVHTSRIPFAQFEQPPGVHDSLPDVRDPTGNVYLAGDYTRWSSIQGALESGSIAAGAVVEDSQ